MRCDKHLIYIQRDVKNSYIWDVKKTHTYKVTETFSHNENVVPQGIIGQTNEYPYKIK